MVGVTISNDVNVQDKVIGISFRRKGQLRGVVILSVFTKVAQSNARFNALDKLVVNVHSASMPARFGRKTFKSKGKPLQIIAHLKRSIVEVKSENSSGLRINYSDSKSSK